MKVRLFFILALFLVSCSDQTEIDKENVYNDALELYRANEFDKALNMLSVLFSSEDEPLSSELMPRALYLRGFLYYLQNSSKNAYIDYMSAIEIANENGDGKLVSRLNNEIGQIFFEKELYEQSLDHFSLALKQSGDATYQDKAYYCFGVGKSLRSLNRHSEAIDYLLQAVEINDQLRNHDALADDYMEIGIIYRKAGSNEESIKMFEKVLSIAPLTRKKNLHISKAYNSIGNVYLAEQDYNNAERYFLKSLKYQNKEAQLWVTYNNLGKVYNAKEEYEKAWNCFKQSLAYNSEKGEMNELAITNTALKKTFEKLNQPDSLLYYTMKINDMALPIMETKSWLKDEDEKIALLTKYQKYEQEKAEREQYAKTSWLMAFIMTFIFVSGVLSMRLWKIYNYKSAQKGHALIKNSNEMVYLLDMFKKEKEEMKKVMDQKMG